jgi:acylphosphatase
MNSKICRHCFVGGRVQGVSFRYATQMQAQRLGVSGWARNLPDGRVEVLACGEAQAVDQLCVWLHQGPSLARVTEVKCTLESQPNFPTGFSIG